MKQITHALFTYQFESVCNGRLTVGLRESSKRSPFHTSDNVAVTQALCLSSSLPQRKLCVNSGLKSCCLFLYFSFKKLSFLSKKETGCKIDCIAKKCTKSQEIHNI